MTMIRTAVAVVLLTAACAPQGIFLSRAGRVVTEVCVPAGRYTATLAAESSGAWGALVVPRAAGVSTSSTAGGVSAIGDDAVMLPVFDTLDFTIDRSGCLLLVVGHAVPAAWMHIRPADADDARPQMRRRALPLPAPPRAGGASQVSRSL